MMIKKLTAACITVFCSYLTLNAQIQTGKILLGVQVGYATNNINYTQGQPNQAARYGAYNFSIGKVFKPNTVWGVTLGYSPSSVTNFFNGIEYVNSNIRAYNGGIFYRRYITLAKNFYFFAEVDAGFTTARQNTADTAGNYTEVINQNGGQLTLMPGLLYKLTKKLNAEIVIPNLITIQYLATNDNIQTQQQAQTTKQRQFLFNTNTNASGLNFLGIGFYFEL